MEIGDVDLTIVQPQRGPGGWCGSVCWPMSLMGSAHAPRARARVSGNAFDFFSFHFCAPCPKCKAAAVFHLAIAHKTLTYHPGADFNGRASKPGSGFTSSIPVT